MIISKINQDEWQKNKTSNLFFESSFWLQLLKDNFPIQNTFLKVANAKTTEFLVLQTDSNNNAFLPFIGYSNYLVNSPNFESDIKKFAYELKHTLNLTLQRAKLNPIRNNQILNDSQNKETTAILKLKNSITEQKNIINKKNKYAYKYAQKNGIFVKPIKKEELDIFYSFYLETMQRVKSSYLTPISMFSSFVSEPSVKFYGAYLANKLVAGSVFFTNTESVLYWYNASNYMGRKFSANYEILFQVIKESIKENKKYLDLASSHTSRIERTKLRWGAQRFLLKIWSANH